MNKFTNINNFLRELGKFKIITFSILFFLILSALLSGQNNIPPIDRDEARFAQASRQMVQSNDYINIKFQDEMRAKKPIGIYWLQAASGKIFGLFDIGSFRIPSLVSSIISIIFTGLIARLIFPFYETLIVTMFFSSSMAFLGEAHLAKTDATLLSLICIQQYFLLKLILKKENTFSFRYLYPIIIWIAFSFGVLVKGPLSFVILFPTIITFCFLKKNFNLIKTLNPILGIIICSIIILPWFFAIDDATQGLFFQKALNDDFINKLESGQESHGAWPGTHLLILSIAIWPIATFLPSLILFALENKKNLVVQFLICWIVPFWIIIELVPTKLFHYSLPVLPAIAILAVGSLFHLKSQIGNLKSSFLQKTILFFSIIFGLGGVVLGVAILYFSNIFNIDNNLYITFLSVIALIITLVIFILSIILILKNHIRFQKYQKLINNFHFAIIGLASIFNIINFQFIFPSLDYLYPSKIISKKINYIKPDAVVSSGYHEPSLVFLLNGNILLSTPQEAAIFLAEGKNNLGLIEKGSLEEFLLSVKQLNLKLDKKEVVEGYNIAKGKHIEVHIFQNQIFDQSN
jgi:4-amino-4-deoxy-L-arabinose transferase-like glycosyltransferase